MRIAYVTPRYAPNVGGVETHVKELGERLAERGHEISVITADYTTDLPEIEEINQVTVNRLDGFSPGGAYHIAPQVAKIVRSTNADLVHAHSYHAFPLFFAALGVQDRPFVTTPHYHGGSANRIRDKLLHVYKPFGRWALQKSDTVIAVSEWEAEMLEEDFDIQSTVIPNGLNVERFESAEPEDRERPYVLTVGRLERYKGVQYAIRAMEHLPEYELVIAGSGPYREELNELVTVLGLSDRVSFEGYVDESRLPSLYAGADVFLTLSKFEAYGLTVGEALASGTPCVVRESGALIEWADRVDCVSIDDVVPIAVAKAIHQAESLSAPHSPIPKWDDVVDEIEEIYLTYT